MDDELRKLLEKYAKEHFIHDFSHDNGNLEVFLRRTILENAKNIHLSSLASSILDYEILDVKHRKGIVGALQIPLSVVGPVNFSYRGERGKTYLVFADIVVERDFLETLIEKLSTIDFITVEDGVIQISGDNRLLLLRAMLSYSIATGIDFSGILNNLLNDSYMDPDILEPSYLIFSFNPTIRDVAKILTGIENPSYNEYKDAVKKGALIILSLLK